MRMVGEMPDADTYSALITVSAQGGKTIDAMELLDAMRVAKMAPNVIAYNALIKACEDEGKAEAAQRIFESLNDAGLRDLWCRTPPDAQGIRGLERRQNIA